MSVLNTAVTGMLASSNWLSTIGQNVANANTDGYKNAGEDFSDMIAQTPGTPVQLAGVSSSMVFYNSLQGALVSTSTSTDMGVQGAGFFVVSDASGNTFLTRDGSFVADAKGNLVNGGGYYLMGAPTTATTAATQSVNSLSMLQKINVGSVSDSAEPSTTAAIVYNLPSSATSIAPADLPSVNTGASQYTDETTITAYDDLGAPHTINVYFAKTAANTWQVAAYNSSDAAAAGGFPYSSAALATGTLSFNATTGDLSTGSPLTLTVPGGQSVSIDLSKGTQLASTFAVTATTIDGFPPGTMTGVSVAATGVMSFQYSNGASTPKYIVPLANVASPDSLGSVTGNAFQANVASGAIQLNNPQTAGLGAIESSSLESSTVDLATELTNMIQAQNSYTANSKVFQTGANIFDVLNNLKS